jgi:hypothetical protein
MQTHGCLRTQTGNVEFRGDLYRARLCAEDQAERDEYLRVVHAVNVDVNRPNTCATQNGSFTFEFDLTATPEAGSLLLLAA